MVVTAPSAVIDVLTRSMYHGIAGMKRMRLTIAVKRYHHQNSEREARPWKVT
jgi:hypothetical protein